MDFRLKIWRQKDRNDRGQFVDYEVKDVSADASFLEMLDILNVDLVKKGQVIARLDRDQLLAQRDREAAGLQAVTAQLAQAETSLAWQRENQAADLQQRKADLEAYEARLQELKNGARPQEIEEIKAAVESAQSEYERARRDWERAQTLYKNDDISTAH